MRQADVTEADILNVVRIWRTLLETEDAGNLDELSARSRWSLFEAEQYLLTAACVYLGMPPPRHAAFSCLNTVDEACECEAVIIWSKKPAVSLDPDIFVEGVVTRLANYQWPGTDLPANRDEHVRYVIWRMALLKKVMDKEAPACISGR